LSDVEENQSHISAEGLSSQIMSRSFFATLIGLTFVMNTIGRGVTETFAVFLLPVEQAFDVTRSEISATYSIYMLVHGLAAPFAGQLIDRLGARITYATGLVLLGAGYVGAGMSDALWQYYLTVGGLGGLGAACLGMVVASSLLVRWFTRRLGTLMALPYAAVGAGMLIIPPLSQILLTHYSWRVSHQILGGSVLAFLPLVMVLPLRRITFGSIEWQALKLQAGNSGKPIWTAMRAMRTGGFWALFGVYFFVSVAAYSVLPQSVVYLVERGFDPLVAASAFGVTGALSVFGVIATGWLSDRLGRLTAFAITVAFTITGTLSLLSVAWFPSLTLVYAFVFFFGIMQGARGPIIAVMVSVLFRGGSVGTIFGALSMALGFGAGFGSLISGMLRDVTGDYIASFMLSALCSAIGLGIYCIAPSLRLERQAALPE